MTKAITVRGMGCISAKPDYITLSMTIEELDKDHDSAMAYAAKRVAMLQAAAQQSGYSKSDLKTVSFNAEARYENIADKYGKYTREFTGYACIYHLKLSFDLDAKQLSKVISSIGESGAKPEISIAFTIKDPAKVSEELLVSASENASTKAEILCRASGCSLGALINIDYSFCGHDIISQTSFEADESVRPLMAASCTRMPELMPDDIKLSDTAAFTWEIF